MEQTHTSMDLMKGSDRLGELQMDGSGEGERELRMDRSEGGLKDLILKWFMETQAALILCEGNFPSWFQGFISRQDAEDILRDKTLGCFLIRLSAKAIGYILSYRGKDRCRHFVINQNKEGLLVVSGDFTAHRNLIDLIEHFKTTPIQPFGEYLASTTTETSSDELYDVVQNKSSMRSCVSVQALCSLWDQRGDVIEGVAPNLPPKSSRRLTSSASVGSHALVQERPALPKKNVSLRNSFSAYLPPNGPLLAELKKLGRTGLMEGPNEQADPKRNNYSWRSEGFSSLTPSPSTNQNRPIVPPKSPSCTYFLMKLKAQGQHKAYSSVQSNTSTLKPNPLYQASSVLSTVQTSPEPPQNQVDPGKVSELSNRQGEHTYSLVHKPIHTCLAPLTPDQRNMYEYLTEHRHSNTYEHLTEHQHPNTYEHLTEHQQTNTYEHLTEHQQTNTYEHLTEHQHSNTYEHLTESPNNTYELIAASASDTYASVDEFQSPHLEEGGKKSHKWWKILPDSKRK